MRCSLALIAGALMLSASALTSYAEEEGGSNVMFIFDSSGSMKKQIASGESRSDAAKRAMVAALSGMPPEAKLGLLMYGHRRAKDCTDIEMVAPFGATDSNGIAQTILDSQPKGETPIAAALESAASSFASLPGQSNSVVLVTDGIEECGGDPCAAARAIREAGIGLKVHVVGFTLSDEQRQTVQCVADETGGKYFDAQDADGLSGALAEVQKAVAEVPAEPVRERVFFDEFDGADLAEHWSVINPNPDGYVVEKGALLMVNSALGSFDKADSANIIQLQRDLPAEDWDIHVTFTGEFKSGQDRFSVGLRTDDKNFLSADLTTKAHYLGSYMWLSLVKNTDGTATRVDTIISHDPGITLGEEQLVAYTNKLAASSMKLTISKRGRAYSTAFTVQGDGKQIVHRTESLTSLRSPGKLAVGVGKWAEANGEIMINIESIEIETVKAAP